MTLHRQPLEMFSYVRAALSVLLFRHNEPPSRIDYTGGGLDIIMGVGKRCNQR